MAFLRDDERHFLEQIALLALANPFLPERRATEKAILGSDYLPRDKVWSRDENDETSPNLLAIVERLGRIIERLQRRAESEAIRLDAAELRAYREAVSFLLYHRWGERLDGDPGRKIGWYGDFVRELSQLLEAPLRLSDPAPDPTDDPPHLLAVFFQLRRSFFEIYDHLIGASMPAARLRAAVWQSVFSHDVRRYVRSLHRWMADFTTLIVGPSGSGKELVARAIARSQYLPFDPKTERFASGSFLPLNLSALSAGLIESELFGHAEGAFTGAARARPGWLEIAGAHGTVFLDEIGEIDAGLQVKLLRVLQTRGFQRIGETETRSFGGKIVAATNRDLEAAIGEGLFREDFYYRICSDVITTPSLAELLRDSPSELGRLLHFVARRIAPDEAEPLAVEAEQWIVEHLGESYAWPGNVRELEQCVRSILLRQDYRPRRLLQKPSPATQPADSPDALIRARIHGCEADAEELLRWYCTRMVHATHNNYLEASRRLGLDRRTVKAKVDPDLLSKLQG